MLLNSINYFLKNMLICELGCKSHMLLNSINYFLKNIFM